MKEQILGPLADRYRDYAEDIHGSGKHLLDLINDLLNTAKIEAGHLKYHEEPVGLREILGEAIRLTRLLESDARHTLDLNVPEPLPALLGDRRSLKQLLINLLVNAVKFTPQGGRIGVAASMAGRSIEIVISDNGIGIPKDRLADLCQPFKRIENVLSSRHQGSGIGLFITKTLVERGQGGGEAGRPAVHGRTLTNKERAEAKYWRGKMAAAGVGDVRDLLRAGRLTDEEVAMINGSYQRAFAAERMRLPAPAVACGSKGQRARV
jgi:K+-sensing histidine kinase KdpD